MGKDEQAVGMVEGGESKGPGEGNEPIAKRRRAKAGTRCG